MNAGDSKQKRKKGIDHSMQKTTDLTQGPITRQLLWFALPIFLSSLLNQVYYLVDTLIISTFLGDAALGAVTNCLNLVWLITSFVFGIGMGMNVVVAQAFGAKNYKWMHRAEYSGIAGAVVASLCLALLAWPVSEPILRLMQTPEEVIGLSASYLVPILAGSGGQMLFMICAGITQAAGDSKTPLYFLVFASCLNIALDLLFIAVLHVGIAGAAYATLIAQWLTGIMMVIYLCRVNAVYRIEFKKIRIYKDAFKEILRMGIPGAVESSATAFANTLVQTFVNTFGMAAMAACGAFATIEGFCFLPITAFCEALGTFAGQNAGARNEARTRKGVKISVVMMMATCMVIGLAVLAMLPMLLSIFVHNPESLAFGLERGKVTLLFYPVLGLTHCLAAVFRGTGKPVIPMIAYLGSWGVIRVILLWSVLPVWHSFTFLAAVYPITWTISSVFLCVYYWKGNWFGSREASDPDEEALAAV